MAGLHPVAQQDTAPHGDEQATGNLVYSAAKILEREAPSKGSDQVRIPQVDCGYDAADRDKHNRKLLIGRMCGIKKLRQKGREKNQRLGIARGNAERFPEQAPAGSGW